MTKTVERSSMYMLLTFFAIIFIFPFVYALYNSLLPLSMVDELVSPLNFSLKNYINLFENYPILKWIGNTILLTVVTVVGNVVLDCMAGYALARIRFPGKNLMFIIVLASMMIPYQLILTPLYIQIATIGWADSMLSITIPFLYQCLYIFMARQFFITIPKEVEEAARIDGVGTAGTFFKIIVPISGNMITSIVIFNFTTTWNAFMVPTTFLVSHDKFPLVVGLNTVKDTMFQKMNLTLAGVVLLSLPIVIMFLLLQRNFMQGIASVGIKG